MEHVFKDNGRIYRRQVTETEIQIGQEVSRVLMKDFVKRIGPVCEHELGTIEVSVDSRENQSMWWIALTKLPLRATYKASTEVVTPSFGDASDPVMTLHWAVPQSMRLIFMTEITRSGDRATAGVCYLFAISRDNNCWKLPIGNIYDDCHLCMGEDYFRGANALEAFALALHQFSKSQWNRDLWRDSANCSRLFRFKPNETEFVQLPINTPSGDWTRLCPKVGTSLTRFFI